jgi:hypothetical protein
MLLLIFTAKSVDKVNNGLYFNGIVAGKSYEETA